MQIAPSILTADFCELGKLMEELVSEGIDWIHLDVMDGNWVINKTITSHKHVGCTWVHRLSGGTTRSH